MNDTVLNTSEAVAVEGGLSVITSTFDGITQFMADAPLFGVLMVLTVVSVGVALFNKLVRRLASSRK